MKKALLPLFTFGILLFFSSCSEWSAKRRADLKESCITLQELTYPEDAVSICDCYLNKLIKEYPNADMSEDQSDKALEACSKDARIRLEQENERKLKEMLESFGAEKDSI